MENERLLDDAGLEILRALQDNARVSFAELGRKVHLSGPAITDRVRKMEAAGIINGYHASVNPGKLGYPVLAWAGIRTKREHYQRVIALARELPEVRECHHASEDFDFVLRLVAASTDAMDEAVEHFREYGEVRLSVVHSTPVEKYAT
jgi:Lrp/AsnC family transcriptional regulator, leucine-responsive regulatory protein